MAILRAQLFPFSVTLIFLFAQCYTQVHIENERISDTTAFQLPDTLQQKPAPEFRAIGYLDHPTGTNITDSTVNLMNYQYAADLLLFHPGIFTRDFGGLGHFPYLTLNGNNPEQIQITSDGIQLNDPWSGIYNLFFYPTESFERIEIIDGTRAFLYAPNATGGVINFISQSRRAIRPYSRIRYSESGYGFSIIDGMLSQNIRRNFNVTAGIQHTVFGDRYTNENYDGWNARLKIRYDIGNTLTLFFTEIHNKTNLGLPGGINLSLTPDSLRFDNLQAVVRNADAYEKVTRHDIQAGLAAYPFADSTAVSLITLYFSSNLREYRDEENRIQSNGIFIQQNQTAEWTGIKNINNFSLGSQRITIGAELQSQNIMISPSDGRKSAGLFNIFGKTEINLSEQAVFSPYARFDSYLGERPLSFGGDIHIKPNNEIELFGGYSRSYRFPTFLERNGLDTVITSSLVNSDPERHHLLEAGFKWTHADWLHIDVRSFYRIVWNSIGISSKTIDAGNPTFIYTRQGKRTMKGIRSGITLHTGVLFLESAIQYLNLRSEENNESLPAWDINGGVYYWDHLFNHNLELKAGIQATLFLSYSSNEFNEQAMIFYPGDRPYNIGTTSVFDLVILAHIGSAYFHIILDNVLNSGWIMNNYYPLNQRRLRFGVSWEFLD